MLTTLQIYDGEKMVIDTARSTLYVWHDYYEEYEEWFSIEYASAENTLNDFFSKKISLFSVMSQLPVGLACRYYANYEAFKATDLRPKPETHHFPSKESYYTGVNFALPASPTPEDSPASGPPVVEQEDIDRRHPAPR